MNTLISAENTWVLWAIITGWAAISIYLEQKYQWAAKISGAMLALGGAMILSNLKVIPTDSPVYDQIWSYVVPLAIPLLLLQCNIKKIWKESGRILIIFLISSMGTMIGAVLGYGMLKNLIPDIVKVTAMMTGSYIGGGVNFVAMADTFGASGDLVSSLVVADNLLAALYFFVLIIMPSIAFFRRKYTHPHLDEVEMKGTSNGETTASEYWKGKSISLKDMAFAVATAFFIAAVSTELAKALSNLIPTNNAALELLNGLLGNKYLIITTVSMILATVKADFFGEIAGAQEIGTLLIYLFFVVIGVPASIGLIIQKSPLLLVYCAVIVVVNMVFTFGVGRLLKFDLEEMILASNANIGGPTTAAAMAISKGWTKLVAPIMLVGTLGYLIGNYCGIFIGNILM